VFRVSCFVFHVACMLWCTSTTDLARAFGFHHVSCFVFRVRACMHVHARSCLHEHEHEHACIYTTDLAFFVRMMMEQTYIHEHNMAADTDFHFLTTSLTDTR
jgi:hypothetical protein